MQNEKIPKIQKIKLDSNPEVKVFLCLNDLRDYGEINLSAVGTSIPRLIDILDIIKIKRPNLFKYVKNESVENGILSNKKKQLLHVKLALNKPNELPEGYSKFKEDELKKNYCQKKVNLFNDFNKILFGTLNGKAKIYKKCQEILDRQKYYYMKYNRITEITILYSGLFNEIKLFGKEFVDKIKDIVQLKLMVRNIN
jgi:hypothetical protein